MNSPEQYETEQAEIALEREVPQYNEQRAEAIYKILKRHNVHRVLDVGCGLGKVTVYLAEKGLDVTGIDISPRLIALAKKKAVEHGEAVDFEVRELAQWRPEKKYDAVLFAGVLEHIPDEERLMREARNILTNEGKIVITDLPAFPRLYHPRDRRIGHVRRYTKQIICEKLTAQGYTNVELTYYNFLMLFGSLYLLFFGREEYPYSVVNQITNRVIDYWYKYLENNFIFPIGDRLIAVAQVAKVPPHSPIRPL